MTCCKTESVSSYLSFPLFVHFSFSPISFSVTDFSASMRARVFIFCIHVGIHVHVDCRETKPKMLKFICAFFPFVLFPISHSYVIHREICVKDFSGTAVLRTFNRGSTVGFLLLRCSSGVVRHPRGLRVSVAARFCRVLIFASS